MDGFIYLFILVISIVTILKTVELYPLQTLVDIRNSIKEPWFPQEKQ